MKRVVGICHPGHFALTGTNVRPGHVFSRSDKSLLDQLGSVAPGDPLDLSWRVVLRIESNASFGSTERNIDDGAFVCHQRRKSHDFVRAHHLAEPGPALYRFGVMAVLCTPSLKDFVVIVSEADRELEVTEVIAGLDLAQERRMKFQMLRCAVELFGNDSVEVEILG